MSSDSTSLKQIIKDELLNYLNSLSIEELKLTSRKQCRLYLQKKLNRDLFEYKGHIKSELLNHVLDIKQRCNSASKQCAKRKSYETRNDSLGSPPLKRIKIQHHMNQLLELQAKCETAIAEILEEKRNQTNKKHERLYKQISEPNQSNESFLEMLKSHQNKLNKMQTKYKRKICNVLQQYNVDKTRIDTDFYTKILNENGDRQISDDIFDDYNESLTDLEDDCADTEVESIPTPDPKPNALNVTKTQKTKKETYSKSNNRKQIGKKKKCATFSYN